VSATAGTCPHCQTRIDPWRILRITRRTPYACPSCAGTARLDPHSGTTVVAGFVCALGIPLVALSLLGASRAVLFILAVAGALAIPFVFARFCRFEPAGDRPERLA
jgi:hypothetical protein